jgi:hypothetical protein
LILPSNASDGLQVNEFIEFQRREWRLGRVIWSCWFVFLGLGVVGLFGHGPISEAAVNDESGQLRVEYGRFERADTESELRIDLEPVIANDGKVEVWFSENFVEEILIRAISPEPVETVVQEGRTVFQFLVDDDLGRLSITFTIEHPGKTFTRSEIGIVEGPAVHFWQLVYP